MYLALALWRGVGLDAACEQLLPAGKERIGWAKMAAVLVAAMVNVAAFARRAERSSHTGSAVCR